MMCKLKESIYMLNQVSCRWYLMFDKVMNNNDFIKNHVDRCIYLNISGRDFIILILYGDDIILLSNNNDMLQKSKHLLSHHSDMKDLGEA